LPPLPRRCSDSSWRTVPTRQGTHWPHDSSRKNAAIRSTTARRSTASSNTITTPDPSVVPAARVSSCVRGRSSSPGVTNVPAAPPDLDVERVHQAGGPRRADRLADAGCRKRILAANVDERLVAIDRERRDRHRFDDREWILFQEYAILERTRFGLVGVADEIVG